MRSHWKLFPAIWRGGHKPLVKWGEEASSDPDVIRGWLKKWPDAYLCVATAQSGITILDIDDKNGKQGSASLFELEMLHGALPPTLMVETPSGGRHYYFEGASANTVSKVGQGIDTPVMAPVPGALVAGKGEYSISAVGEDVVNATIAPLPEWLYDLIGARREKSDDRHIPLVEEDLPHNINNAVEYLENRAPLAVEGSGGDNTTYKVACAVRDYAISQDLALELMDTHWNGRCEPPWELDELEVKISRAYQYAQNRPGERMAEVEFDPVFLDEPGGPRYFKEYRGEAPERKWLLKEWIPRGEITSLYGKGGLGKSLLAFQIGIAAASGGEFMGMQIEGPIPTLLIACEDSDDELHRRAQAINRSPRYEFMETKDLDLNLLLWSRAGRDAILARSDRNKMIPGKFYDEVKKALEAMGPGHKFVILDTLADFYAGNENDRSSVNYFIKVVLVGLIKRYNATILLLGHPPKNESEYSGSTAWENAVRTRLSLLEHSNENLSNYRVLVRSKSNYAKSGERIIMHYDRGVFEPVEDDDIVDEIGLANEGILLAAIQAQAEKGQPFGTHNASKLNIFGIPIADVEGKPLGKGAKRSLLDSLIMKELVDVITGEKHRPNGIYPKHFKTDLGNGFVST